jgi:ketosteroid isomerase-like protein
MRIRGQNWRAGVLWSLAIAALAMLMGSATSCGDSATTTVSSGSPRQPSPSGAAVPERLAGSDSIATTQKAADAYTVGWDARSVDRLGALYARDVVFDCHATGVHVDGRATFLELLKQVCEVTTGASALAGHAGRGWAVLELRQDFAQGSIQLLQLIETRHGKIVRLANYYQPVESQMSPLHIASPLKSAPGPADTPAAAEAVALKYAAALQRKDAAAVAALSAPTIAFMDTASDTAGTSHGDVQARYTEIFRAPADLTFIHVRYAFGRAWAAVIWTATSAESGGDGVSVLEIRNGTIRRETLYYNSSNVPF